MLVLCLSADIEFNVTKKSEIRLTKLAGYGIIKTEMHGQCAA